MKQFYFIKSGLFFALLLALARPSSAQLPYLVKDIAIGGSSNPSNLTNLNGILFFTAINPNDAYGEELWRSDSTPAGTYMVKDINPGIGSSEITELKNINGTLFFQANDGTGAKLWKSDGTLGGTVKVALNGPELPTNITNVNGTIFFRGTTAANGNELWKSNGTSAGTSLVKDIVLGTGSSFIDNLIDINGTLYFTTMIDGASDLWKSDGTSTGTVMVKSFNTLSELPNFTNLNGTLFFTADDGEHGLELWKSNGTPQGTQMVKDINLGANGSVITQIVNANGTLFFMADDGVHGEELWKSDGTSIGTELVKDILDGSLGAYPHFLTNVNGTVFFLADDLVSGRELWKTDGTTAGTVLVKDIASGSWEPFIINMLAVDNTLYFLADVGIEGNELWKSDGTENGTVLVKDINPGSMSSEVSNMTNVNGKLYFSASAQVSDLDYGTELWSLGACTSTNAIVNTAGKTTVYNTQKQSLSVTCHCDVFNNVIGVIDSADNNSVSGIVDSKVWIDSGAPNYVSRHYEFYPVESLPSSSAKITLYFTQAEFNSYNTTVGQNAPHLPTSGSDVAGISNIIIEKLEWTSEDDTGSPESYSGPVSTINFEDVDVDWNTTAQRWEVSFLTPGFGGFFLKSPVLDTPTDIELSNTAICSGDSVSLWATCLSGTVNWYTSATGGTSLGTSLPLWVKPASTTTYYAACEYNTNSSARVPTNEVVVTAMPTLPNNVQLSSSNICSGSSVTLTANCAIGTLVWYDSATGYDIGTGNNLVQTPTTNKTYYAACESGFCRSEKVTAGEVQITEPPYPPFGVSINKTAVCSGTSVTLTANCFYSTVTWYNQATGGTAIGTGNGLAHSPTTTTTYYVACENSTCKSQRTATSEVVVTPQPASPTAVAVNNTAMCSNSVTSVVLSATCSIGTVTWYNQATGGIALGTGTGLSQSFPSTVTYYAACENSTCVSARVATKEVVIFEQPTNPTDLYQGGRDICVGYGIYLTASCNAGTATWYNSATGGTALGSGSYYSPYPTSTTTYYVACENGSCKSQRVAYDEIVVYAQPVNPTGVSVSSTAICNGDSITLSGSCLIGTLRWYKTSMDPDTAFTYRPKMNTIYYAFCANGFCSSDRVATSQVVVTQKPSKPSNVSVNTTSICATETVTLTATCASGTVSWYSSSSGATTVGTGTTLNHTPSASITYYAGCVNGICNSERVATDAVIVKAKPTTPAISSTKPVICNGESVTLTASAPANTPAATFRWSGGLSSSTAALTVSPSTTSNYKVLATFNGCNSDSSAIFKVTVNQTPQQPSITSDKASICKGTSAILTAQCPSTTDNFYWSNAALPNAGPITNSYQNTRTISEPGTYKGWCESSIGCRSAEKSITITAGSNCNSNTFISITPAKPILCPGSSVTLTATGCSGTLTWLGGTSSQTGTSITINPSISTTYVAQCSAGGSGSVDVTVVTTAVTVNNNITTGSEKIKALNTIESAKKIGDSNITPAPSVVFEAGKSILLKPGFVADSRSIFIAQIKGCN